MSITNRVKIFEEGEIVKLVCWTGDIKFGMIDEVIEDTAGAKYRGDFGLSDDRFRNESWRNHHLRKATEQEKFLYCAYGHQIDEEIIMKESKFVKFCKHYVGGQFNNIFRIMSYGALIYLLLLGLVFIVCGGIDMIFIGAPAAIITVGIIAGISASLMAVVTIFCVFGFLISLLVCEIRGQIIR